MNKLLLIALAGTGLFASVPAHADALPGAYVGLWCFESTDKASRLSFYSYGGDVKENTSLSALCATHDYITIKRDGYALNEEACKFISIKHTGKKAAPSPKAKLEDYIPIIRTVARCIGEGVDEIWRERQELTYYRGSLTIKQLK